MSRRAAWTLTLGSAIVVVVASLTVRTAMSDSSEPLPPRPTHPNQANLMVDVDSVSAYVTSDEIVVSYTVTNNDDEARAVAHALPTGGAIGAAPDPDLVQMHARDGDVGFRVGFWQWTGIPPLDSPPDTRPPEEYPYLFMIRLEPGESMTRELRIARPASGNWNPDQAADEMPDPPEWIQVCLGVGRFVYPQGERLVEVEPYDRLLYEVSQGPSYFLGGVGLERPDACAESVSVDDSPPESTEPETPSTGP